MKNQHDNILKILDLTLILQTQVDHVQTLETRYLTYRLQKLKAYTRFSLALYASVSKSLFVRFYVIISNIKQSTSTSPKLEWRPTIQYLQYSQDSQIDQVFYHISIYKFQSNHSTLSGRQKKKTELVDELTHALLSKLQGTQLNNMQDEQKKFNLNFIRGIMLPTVMTRPCTNQNQNAFQKSKLASFGNWKHGKILNITRFMFFQQTTNLMQPSKNAGNLGSCNLQPLSYFRQLLVVVVSQNIISHYFVYASKMKIKEAKTQAEVKQHDFERVQIIQLILAC
ncbi:Hypothetical_protein [Hexamita inflata]|uniref:Hypothetical_protein n=1 Tax=Hexamita inflata TaxID=28002 RepID=A0AA86USG1_9EUKA|nr:Hypothetical protein HINF_LOCUS50747 [Hexamita inflata]